MLEFSNMEESDVPDPYYTNNFEGVYEMVQSSCDNLIDFIVKDANLKEGNKMENKLIPGILIGAIVGGAATLADKSTRNALIQSVKMLKKVIVHANLLNSILLKTKFYIGKIQLKKFVAITQN